MSYGGWIVLTTKIMDKWHVPNFPDPSVGFGLEPRGTGGGGAFFFATTATGGGTGASSMISMYDAGTSPLLFGPPPPSATLTHPDPSSSSIT